MPVPASPSPAGAAAVATRAARLLARLRRLWRRWLLWGVLALVVLGLLATLVWLARGHEIDQVQRNLERETAEAAQALRQHLARNVQDLHGLATTQTDPAGWSNAAQLLLLDHREWLRLQWLNRQFHQLAVADSPFHASLPMAADEAAPGMLAHVEQACAQAAQSGQPTYAPTRFVPGHGGIGIEVMSLCLPILHGTQLQGYVVATHTLDGLLLLLPSQLTRGQGVSFTELDGTRLATQGAPRRTARVFTAQHVLDLPGAPMVLRVDGSRPLPDVFPNVLTALVTGLSVALVTVLVLLARDFRRRQQAETELAQSLALRKAMEDSLVTGLRARDLHGRITYVNPAFCKMVGYSADELVGQATPAPYWPPERTAEYAVRQAERMAGHLPPPREGAESVFMRKDGTRFPVLIFEAPLITASGTHTGWMSAVMDMTELRHAEELSRASQERLQASARLATVGEMASLMSHELNQPLAVISSYATGALNLLRAGDTSPEPDGATARELRVAIARIADQAGRAGKVIHSVRELVRQRSTARTAAAPRALIDTILPLVLLQAHKLAVSVRVDAPASLPLVWCEPTMIEQVLMNLARNALQAMDGQPGPRVLQLRARALDGPGQAAAVEFSVADSGEGISDEVAAQLFTPFFTTKAEGMGLGLSLCRTVIEQHGSALHHQPNAPRGTEFAFALPVAESSDAA